MLMNFPFLVFISLSSSWRALALIVAISIGAFSMAGGAAETILHGFNAWPHGWQPSGGLIADKAGNLYGVTFQGGAHYFGAVYELTSNSKGGWSETLLYSFTGGLDGNSPVGSLAFDAAGNLYGATIGGGAAQSGTIFELTKHANGRWTEKVIWNFHGEDGFTPNGGLIFDKAGNIYGTTASGGGQGVRKCGQGGCGLVFRLSPQANEKWTETVLYRFRGSLDGAYPNGNLIADSAGKLYGSTNYGGDVVGDLGSGVLFELSEIGDVWNETVIHAFTGETDGFSPDSPIIDRSGNLYLGVHGAGTSTNCSGGPCGAIVEFTPRGNGQWNETMLHSFDDADGNGPTDVLTFDEAGSLYGTTAGGGTAQEGTVFRLSPIGGGRWSETVLWNFMGGNDGAEPYSGVVLGAAGQIYGTTLYDGGVTGNGTAFELAIDGNAQWQEKTLSNFADGSGNALTTSVTTDTSGNIYGTASRGGEYGAGSLFELILSGNGMWSEKILYNFPSGTSEIGYYVNPSSLVVDAAGNLYGETEYSGAGAYGTVFELSPSASGWTEQDIYTFAGGVDGRNPQGGLIFDKDGNLYGTLESGGTGCGGHGCGTVFELSSSAGGWTKRVLYDFMGGSADGQNPVAGLVFDAAGNLYGTTLGGGLNNGNDCGIGCGTVFELSPAGNGKWNESTLHFFTNKQGDGATPFAGLVLDSAGNLYGTTSAGGTQSNPCGTVFEVSPTGGGWTETVIYEFSEYCGTIAGLVFDQSGNLYGTNSGTVFELSPVAGGAWVESTVHSFNPSGSDGAYPDASLIVNANGSLYGTTYGGGSGGGGTVFEIVP